MGKYLVFISLQICQIYLSVVLDAIYELPTFEQQGQNISPNLKTMMGNNLIFISHSEDTLMSRALVSKLRI